ncbi:hypothetical protein AOXY_G34815 [Acipenser oxyrinchus oxyrinchus]|uniref:Uncharacterized protein n=1 Tax=Acipenser oxyrinchus oxyrinchus TaxID=40147 RepID=A0AAD8CGC1_ACIOX|nr:hypothetical protein AOXY_G34815 [Acipenser oxyrinchus oxyrinchus]
MSPEADRAKSIQVWCRGSRCLNFSLMFYSGQGPVCKTHSKREQLWLHNSGFCTAVAWNSTEDVNSLLAVEKQSLLISLP